MFCNKHMHTAHAQHMHSNISHKFTHNNNTRKRTPNNASQQMHTTVHQWGSTRGWNTYSPTPSADGRGIGQGGCGHTGWECMRVCGVPRNRGWTPRRNKREKDRGGRRALRQGSHAMPFPGYGINFFSCAEAQLGAGAAAPPFLGTACLHSSTPTRQRTSCARTHAHTNPQTRCEPTQPITLTQGATPASTALLRGACTHEAMGGIQ